MLFKRCVGVVKPKQRPKKPLTGRELLALADAAPRIPRTSDILPAVDKLRDKGYSWRKCAEWLKENAGIEIDHANLYRLSENREVAKEAEELEDEADEHLESEK